LLASNVRDQILYLSWISINLKYKKTFIGIIWSFASPVSLMLVMGFIFSSVFKMSYTDYVLHLFTGMSAWIVFSNTVVSATGAFTGNEGTLKKLPIYPIVFPCVALVSSLAEALPIIILTQVLLLLAGKVDFISVAFSIPVYLFVSTLGFAIGSVLGLANIFFRDINYIVGICLQIGFYATPILYKSTALGSHSDWIIYANPMANFINMLLGLQIGYDSNFNVVYGFVVTASFLILAIFLVLKYARRVVRYL
jgi:ABC-type polysaccharide/polyol phosphate export permease